MYFLFCVFALQACSKPDPNPELKDQLFLEYRAMADESAKLEETGAAEVKKALDEVNELPVRSSNRKILEKRYWDTIAKVDKAKQSTQYYRQKMLERQKIVTRRYLISFYQRTPAGEDEAFKEYSTIKKMRNVSRDWNPKKRIEDSKRPPPAPAAPSGGH